MYPVCVGHGECMWLLGNKTYICWPKNLLCGQQFSSKSAPCLFLLLLEAVQRGWSREDDGSRSSDTRHGLVRLQVDPWPKWSGEDETQRVGAGLFIEWHWMEERFGAEPNHYTALLQHYSERDEQKLKTLQVVFEAVNHILQRLPRRFSRVLHLLHNLHVCRKTQHPQANTHSFCLSVLTFRLLLFHNSISFWYFSPLTVNLWLINIQFVPSMKLTLYSVPVKACAQTRSLLSAQPLF